MITLVAHTKNQAAKDGKTNHSNVALSSTTSTVRGRVFAASLVRSPYS